MGRFVGGGVMTDTKNKTGLKAAGTRNEALVPCSRKKCLARPLYPKARQIGKEKLRAIRDDGGPQVIATGQTAKALRALVLAGKGGVTALEVSTWAYRFAAYCHDLRKKGLDIETLREGHEGGWHGRHVLLTDVRLEPVHD